jgi:hypothetical protein
MLLILKKNQNKIYIAHAMFLIIQDKILHRAVRWSDF